MLRITCVAIVFVISAAGCSLGKKAAGPVLAYEMKDRVLTIGDCDSAGRGCVRGSFRYPEIHAPSSGPLRDSVDYFLKSFLYAQFREGSPCATFDDLMGQLGEEYKNLREEFRDYTLGWELTRNVEVLADTCGIVSFRATEFSFLGGAHPNSAVRLAVVAVPSGKKVLLNECLVEGAEARLVAEVEREFRKVRNLLPDAGLEAAGFWFKDGKFVLPANIAVEPSGLLFYYNDYEIAPHSMGPTEVKVPFESLQGVLSPDGPLGLLAVAGTAR
jgi:Protein of unknown function (DUF3298)